MKMNVLAVWVLGSLMAGFGLLIAAGDAKQEAINKDRRLYEGTWKVVSLVADGDNLTEEDCKRITVLNELDWLEAETEVDTGLKMESWSYLCRTRIPAEIVAH